MVRYRVITNSLLGAKLKPSVNYQYSLRWITGTAAEKHFDEASLKAARPFEDLPSMTMLPFIGTAWGFLPVIGRYDPKSLNKALLEKRKLFGDIYREKFGPLSFVVSFSADDLQTMYEHEGMYPARTDFVSMRMYRESRKDLYTTIGLTLSNGKEWLELRKKTQKHLMKPKAVLAFLDPMQDVARDFVLKISTERDENKEVPNLLGEIRKWSLESVALVGLDARMGCLEKDLSPDSDGMRMIIGVQTAIDCVSKLELFLGNLPFWRFFPTPTWKNFTEACDTFSEIAFRHIKQSLERLKKAANDDQDLTLLQSMILSGDMDVSTAMVTVADMMTAGIDTTSNTVGFLLKHIAKNPEKQELLYQHIKTILPNKEDRITPSLFNELRYLKACLKESQRLDPIVGVQGRTLDHDVIFSGYRIPAGVALLVVTQAIFRDEKYFSKPNEFIPERWLNKDEKFHPFAFLPFGFGTRSCVGRRLAELEMLCVTAEIIRNFKIEYHHEEIGVYTGLLNSPDKPLRFTFIDR